jgi:hypothetical protein
VAIGGLVTSSRVVALQPLLGLSNRLRAISSFHVLALRTGRDFRLSWVPSQGFSDEDLSALVENAFVRIDEAEFDALCSGALRLEEAGELSAHDLFEARQHVIAYRGHKTVDALVGARAPASLPAGFLEEYKAELTGWRPAPAVGGEVDAVASEFDAHTIGVHVRRGDAIVDPVRGWKFRISSDAAFFRRMDGLLRAEPRTTFFLATDDAETEERFVERYGDAVRTNPAKRFVPSIWREPKQNQHDAVVDLFALSRTQRILGNLGSTFSSLAAGIGDIPLERVVDSSWSARFRRAVGRLLRH